MSTYQTLEQQIHALSLITNAAFGLEFSNYTALESYTSQVVNAILTQDQEVQPTNNTNIGNNYLGSTAAGTEWQLVWGPIVFCHDMTASPIAADNTMALYYNASQNQFVVGIAGTNSVSMYGWETEDFEVGTTVLWTSINPKSAAGASVISTGSSIGISNLLSLTDPNNGGRTMIAQLQYFLVNSVKQNTAYPNPAVAVAGHSLGGALTPLMALYLYETIAAWNTGTYKVKTITAYPTAGPTPGDYNFANYYQGLLSSSFVYVSKYNTLDVVPQAWQLKSMVTIPFLYDKTTNPNSDIVPTTPPDCLIASLTLGAIASSVNPTTKSFNLYTQIIPHTPMTGSYMSVQTIADSGSAAEQELYTGASNIGKIVAMLDAILLSITKVGGYSDFLQNFIYFLLEAAYQHTTAYNAQGMLNIQELATEFLYVKQNTPGPTGADQPMHSLLIQKMIATHPMLKGLKALANVNVEAAELAEA